MGRVTSSNQLIEQAVADAAKLQPVFEFWNRLQQIKFHQAIREALIAQWVDPGKADELSEVMRVHIERISSGMDNAIYSLKEIVAEMADARSRVDKAGPSARFKI
jgi:hypothetical protein